MKAACYGFTTHIITSHLVFLADRQSSHKIQTQCPGISNQKCPEITQKCPGITQLPNIVMRARAPLENIQSSSWYNSNLSANSSSQSSVCNPVPRTNLQKNNETVSVRETAVSSSLPPKRKRDRKHRRERRAREREERGEAFIHDARWANQRPGDPSSSSIPAQVTQSGLQDSDPISAMRPAVYHPHESVGNSLANDNSPFQIDLESGEFSGLHPGLYKPADPDPQHDTWAFSPAAYSSDKGPPSPTRTPAACSSDSRTRTGIVYPLQPRSRQPDVCIHVEASLPEPAALLRPELRQPTSEAPTSLPRTHKRLSRKSGANALQRYTAQPNAHLHGGIGVMYKH